MQTEAQENVIDRIAREYAEANPVTIYADYRDVLSAELVQAAIENPDSFWESAFECETGMQDSWFEYGFKDYAEESAADCGVNTDNENLFETFKQALAENLVFDFSDYWRSTCRNTRANIVLVPINPETGEAFETVHWQNDFAANLANARALRKYFGIRNYRAIESCYTHETLKILGQLDLWAILERGRLPDSFEISPQDSAIFHTSWNGSGCLGDVKITKTCRLKCAIRHDDSDRYGVQAVYGFTGKVWSNELTPIYSDAETNETAA